MTDSHGKKQFLLRISEDLHTEIKSSADRNNLSMSAWITMAVRHWLDMDETALESAEAQGRSERNRVKDKWWMK